MWLSQSKCPWSYCRNLLSLNAMVILLTCPWLMWWNDSWFVWLLVARYLLLVKCSTYDIKGISTTKWWTRCQNNVPVWGGGGGGYNMTVPAVWYFSETTLQSGYHTQSSHCPQGVWFLKVFTLRRCGICVC